MAQGVTIHRARWYDFS